MIKTISFGVIAGASVLSSNAGAQSAIQLEPLPASTSKGRPEVNVTTVHNYYGKCGSAVVQVLGVERQVDNFFTVDAASAEGPAVVVIGPGGRRSLALKEALSDHNGVACISKGTTKYLLVWSNCGGTACGDDFNFTVVGVKQLRVLAGGKVPCDEKCASRLVGSTLPLKLNDR